MFYDPQLVVLHLTAIAIALAILLLAVGTPTLARVLFVLLFSWAAWTNFTTAAATPEAYLVYGPLAVLGLYQRFIGGFFADHVRAFVIPIAGGQALIALGLFAGDRFARIALGGAAVFLLAVAPFGAGSGFPATVLMAAAAVILLRSEAALAGTLVQQIRRRGEAT